VRHNAASLKSKGVENSMNADAIEDLKLFITGAIAQATWNLRQDIKEIRQEIGGIHQEIGGMRRDMDTMRQDIQHLDQKVDEGFAAIGDMLVEIKADIEAKHTNHDKRLVRLEKHAGFH
jgi:predicted  nucleic acid-binding Zn-ribbon protein